MIEWWETLKEGDKILWTLRDWRYSGIVEVVDLENGSVSVDVEHAHTKVKHWRDDQDSLSWEEDNGDLQIVFNSDELMNQDMEWAHRKTADIRIQISETEEGRKFRIWGEAVSVGAMKKWGSEGSKYRVTREVDNYVL